MPNTVTVIRDDVSYTPKHLSKEQDIPLRQGDRVRIGTPGGGGYGDPHERDPSLVLEDVLLGYYSVEAARKKFGVVLGGEPPAIDTAKTAALRGKR